MPLPSGAPNRSGRGARMSEQDKKQHPGSGHDKTFTVIVNGEQKTVAAREITFEQLAELAFPNNPKGGNWLYTVTYRRGEGNKPEGTLVQGETVKLKEGMIFNVTATDRS